MVHPAHRWAAWCAALLLAVLVLLTHGPILFPPGTFTAWDDLDTVAHNPHIGVIGRATTWADLAALWAAPRGHLYIPVTYSLWWAVGAVADTAAAFKWTNVAVHFATTLLLFTLLTRTGSRTLTATLAAALFAVHPLTVETVAWISGLKDLLAAGLGLASVVLAVRSRGQWGRDACLATVLFAAALLAKPSAVVALPVAVLYLIARDPAACLPSPKAALGLLAIWTALAVAAIALTRSLQPPHPPPPTGTAARLAVAADALAWYARHAILPGPSQGPGGPAIDHTRSPARLAETGVPTRTFLLAGGLLALIAAALAYRPTRPVALPLAAAGLTLSPYLGLVSFDFQAYSTVAEHYAYPMLLGLAAALAAALAALTALARLHRAALLVVLPLVSLAASNSLARHGHWHDSQRLFRQTLAAHPDSIAALNNLAALALDRLEQPPTSGPSTEADTAEAADLLARMQPRLPTLPPAIAAIHALNTGRLAEIEGNPRGALQAYRNATALDPALAEAHFRFARLAARELEPAAAIDSYRQALALSHPRAGANLAALYLALNRPADAEAAARAELRLDPDSPAAAGNLAAALLTLGRDADARDAATIVADRSPAAANVLGILAARAGHLDEARRHFQTAVRLDPANAAYVANLARLTPPDPRPAPPPVPAP